MAGTISMFTDSLKQIEAAKAKLAALEHQFASDRTKALAALPSQFGFEDAESFIAALRDATGGKRRGRKPGKSPKGTGKRKRAKVTDEIRAQVKKLVEARKTGAEISKSLGVSLPTVQNIKKALGLVRKGKKK